MTTHTDRAQNGAALAPLSREQKTRLILLIKQAWEKHAPHEDFEAWRVDECLRACGRRLSLARNHDFLPLRAHFRNMLGDSGRAFNDLMRAEAEPRAQAIHILRVECGKASDVLPAAMGYIRGMLKNKGTSLEDASPKQIWHSIFTLRRKAQLERKKARRYPAKPQSREVNCPF